MIDNGNLRGEANVEEGLTEEFKLVTRRRRKKFEQVGTGDSDPVQTFGFVGKENNHNLDCISECGVIECGLVHSDHEAVYCYLAIDNNLENNKYLEIRNFRNIDFDGLNNHLECIDWHDFYYLNDLDSKVSYFSCVINDLFDIHCPKHVIKLTNRKRKPPWMTYNLRQIMLQKRKAFKKFQKSGLRVDKLQYIQLKNVFSTAIKNEKRAYYSYHVHKSFNNSRQLWNNVRKWKIISKVKQEIPDSLTPDLINSNLLCNIPQFDIDSNTLQYYSNNSYPVDENFKFRLATRDEVLDIINSIKTNAEGVDGISIQMIKYCLPYCLDPLTNIVNYSLETGLSNCLEKCICSSYTKMQYTFCQRP
nr:unnamed protein product [Callosobruchus analis]